MSEKIKNIYKDKKIVLLVSGGLDSMGALVALCHYGAKKIQPLFINRSQESYKKEYKAIEDFLDSEIYQENSKRISQLFTMKVDIPAKEMKKRFENSKTDPKDLYFARNSDLINNAARLAHCLNTEERYKGSMEFFEIIASGATKDDMVPDEKEQFFQLKEMEMKFLSENTTNKNQVSLLVRPPFVNFDLNKEDAYTSIIKFDERWKEISKLTWSCWSGEEQPCNNCVGCKNRQKALDNYNLIERKTLGR